MVSTSTISTKTMIGKRKMIVGKLEPDFIPGPTDIVCERGNKSLKHEGNYIFFKSILQELVQHYQDAETKLEKSFIVSEVIRQVREKGGHFVRKNKQDSTWYDVGDTAARERVGQGFRDLLATKYKSSIKSKKLKRTQKMNRVLARASDPNVPSLLQRDSSNASASTSTTSGSTSTGSCCSTSNDTNNSDDEEDSQLEQLLNQANQALLQQIKSNDCGFNLTTAPSHSTNPHFISMLPPTPSQFLESYLQVKGPTLCQSFNLFSASS